MSTAMEPTWVELLDERTRYLTKELTPVKLLPHLNLPSNEKEKITCDERNDGQEKASMTLLQNLKKRDGPNGRKIFEQLVRALRIVGLHHSALLLDPRLKVPSATEVLEDENSFPLGIFGTAAEIRVTIRLLNDETKKYCIQGERQILNLYKDIKSEKTLQLRSELDQVLPEGAAFSAVYNTSKDFVPGCKLRVSQTSAADTIWKTYCEGSLMTLLKEKLLSGVLPELRSRLKMHIHIMREDYETACHILNGRNQTGITDETNQVKNCRIPPVYLNVKSAELRLRPYQEELASPGLAGKNTIVCAPTNSGKTYVALRIARAHLDKYKKEQTGQESACGKDLKQWFAPKVLFVVNRVNLVLQQKHRFDYYLSKSLSPQPKGYEIADISGANAQEKSLVQVVQENDVIVLTAQILVDALKSRRVSITDFSLLIFDECHHTHKGHPYNEIMLQYLAFTYSKHLAPSSSSQRPQIIGLTASLGVGKATNMVDAQEHVLQLCANLDCEVIVTVEENKVDLKGKVGTCKRHHHEIPDGDLDYFDTIIGNVMEKIEGMVPKEPGPNSSPHVNRGSQQYQQWLVGLDKRAVTRGSRELITLVQHLLVYNTALVIKKTCRVKDALKYIEDYQETQNQRKFEDVDHKLRGLYEEAKQAYKMEYTSKGEIKNPKLEAVAKILKKQYLTCAEEGENQTAKGILFTETRENTKALKAWLDENSDLAFIRAERFVGTGRGEDGMTQFQQEEIIANFRCGQVNLLISTTVGEEGIDIPDCNFVIRYNVRGNEIASVQSRGRVRDIKGKYEVVAGKESGVIEKENLNTIREAMMEKAIKAVKAMDEDQYKEKVLELQKRAVCQHKQREKSMKSEKQNTKQASVNLLCRKCQVFACNADSIRCIKEAHHVVIDEEFQSKSSWRRNKVSRVVDGIELTGPLHCLDCDTEWGSMIKYKNKEMPCIKATSFAFQFEDEDGHLRRHGYRKWKLVPLTVEDFDLCETELESSCSSDLELDVENKDGKETTLSTMRGECSSHDEKDVFFGQTNMARSCSFALEVEHKDGSKITLVANGGKSSLSDVKDPNLGQRGGEVGKSPLPDASDMDLGEMRLGCSSDLFQLSLD